LKKPNELKVLVPTGAATTALVYPAENNGAVAAALILAHGAGAGQHSAFMVEFARALSALGLDLVTFNFLYTEQNRRIPDRPALLEACYVAVIDRVRAELDSARRALYIGGKSMGGRIATQVAAADPAVPVAGLVLLGYPLHPPGKPEQRRDKHLPSVGAPMLFLSGTRDPFGSADEFRELVSGLPAATLEIVDGGDHSLAVPKKVDPKGGALDRAVDLAARWMLSV